MADIVLLFVLKGRDCMSKVLIEVLVIILIAGSYLILYSAVRVSAIADQRIAEIQKRETFDKEKQLNTKQSSILGGMATANKEKKIEGRLGYNSENGRYGLLVSDLWEHTGFHCGECLEVTVDDKWVKTRIEMDIDREKSVLHRETCSIENDGARTCKATRCNLIGQLETGKTDGVHQQSKGNDDIVANVLRYACSIFCNHLFFC